MSHPLLYNGCDIECGAFTKIWARPDWALPAADRNFFEDNSGQPVTHAIHDPRRGTRQPTKKGKSNGPPFFGSFFFLLHPFHHIEYARDEKKNRGTEADLNLSNVGIILIKREEAQTICAFHIL
jgi:hypothetical protein